MNKWNLIVLYILHIFTLTGFVLNPIFKNTLFFNVNIILYLFKFEKHKTTNKINEQTIKFTSLEIL